MAFNQKTDNWAGPVLLDQFQQVIYENVEDHLSGTAIEVAIQGIHLFFRNIDL